MYQPLADELRPVSLDDVCGQEHILGPGGLLRRIIESGKIPNMIFYGPSGVGKTTVANIIAARTNRKLCRLNATMASSADIKEIVSQLDTFLAPNGILLYLDEIQYFTKKQQQTLLEHIENGRITLIASTTENPYFYVYNAILSRSTVFEFKAIDAPAAAKAIRRAIGYMEQKTGLTARVEPGALEQMAASCGGDIRKAINAVELLFSAGAVEGNTISLNNGIGLEDARYGLLMGGTTTVCMTMNFRELKHFLELRCCNRAQWEIRELADRIRDKCLEIAPEIFKNSGCACMQGKPCPEGKKSCGHPRKG